MLMIGERLRAIRESKNLRKATSKNETGYNPLLYVACRERPHDSLNRYAPEVRTGTRNSALSTFLRW